MSFYAYLFIGIGGFFGAISRAYFNTFVSQNTTTVFPFATLGVNLVGSFVLGLIFSYFQNIQIDPNIKLMFSVGFLGALTTYSTFSLETVLLFSQTNYFYAVLNIFANVAGGLLLAGIGYKMGSLI